jgi:putative ABC transport system permease protein
MATDPRRSLRLAVRSVSARPALALLRTVTVALVIAAVGGVLLVADAMLLRPLPFRHQDRVVRVFMKPPGITDFAQANPLHPLEFVRFRARVTTLEAVEGVWAAERALGGDGEPESVPAASVSAGLFGMSHAAAVIGRTFTEEEARDGARVVVLSEQLWTARYGRDPAIVGRTISIDRQSYQVVGVMATSFEPAYVQSGFWTPLEVREGRLILPGATFIQTIGRLRAGVTREHAQAELESLLADATRESPQTLKGWTVGVVSLRTARYGAQTPALLLLIGGVVGLSLIAAANLSNLTLADVLARRRDLAMRAALGASRADLIWPEVWQAVLIALVGGVSGILLASWLLPVVLALDGSGALAGIHVSMAWRMMLEAVLFAIAIVTLSAAIPAYRLAASRDLAASLAESGHRVSGGLRQERTRFWLVAVQTALAMALLICSGRIAAGFERTTRINPGLDPANVLQAQLRLPEAAYPTAQSRTAFVTAVLGRIRATPGVIDAATTMNLFVPGFTFQTLVHIDGQPTPDGQPHTVQFRRISDGYFRTMRIAQRAGRDFDSRDVAGGQLSAIVSESFAQRFWPGADPIGRRFHRTSAGPASAASSWTTIVGVVSDVYDVGYGQAPQATAYVPYAQGSNPAVPASLVVRTASDPMVAATAVKAAVWSIDGAQPLARIGTVDRFLYDSLGPQRFRSVLLAILGGVGLLLAAVGIHGVSSRVVVERRHEVGVRLALGGQPWRVWLRIATAALRAFAAGAGAGLVAAMLLMTPLARLFPETAGVSTRNAVFAAILVIISGITPALFAARRVSTVDPLTALRQNA